MSQVQESWRGCEDAAWGELDFVNLTSFSVADKVAIVYLEKIYEWKSLWICLWFINLFIEKKTSEPAWEVPL